MIRTGYKDRGDTCFESNRGFRSRIAHPIDCPDDSDGELASISELMRAGENDWYSTDARAAPEEYIARRTRQPHICHAY